MKNKKWGVLCLICCCFTTSLLAHSRLPQPTPLQLKWQNLETTAFIHFSINTFTNMEWGFGNESPRLFNPTDLDCEQWVSTLKKAGIKGIILTTKHHDGFCLWPTKYTEHSVKNSPWKNGKGDLVGEFVAACRKYDMRVGLYLSPWDCNHPDYGKEEYITYFRNQLTELLTQYGDIYEVWFDGANGGRGYYGTDSLHNRSIPDNYYRWEEQAALVKKLQPNCIIHGGGAANIRWVGNEDGYAGETHWSTLPQKLLSGSAIRKQLNEGDPKGTRFLPSETDVSIRPGWYYHLSEDHQLKSLGKLLDIYYESVGRNSQLLLNVPPTTAGRIHPLDSARLVEWYATYSRELSHNLITDKTRITGSSSKGLKKAIDNNPNTYWQSPATNATLVLDWETEITFNRIMLQENIAQGQRIAQGKIEYFAQGKWHLLDSTLTTVGYKRILRYPTTTASKIKISIVEALAPAQLSNVAVYNAPLLQEAPFISRNQAGLVTLVSKDQFSPLYYTSTGEDPTTSVAKRYTTPFVLDEEATIKAVSKGSDHTFSPIAERKFGASKKSWSLVGDTKNQHLLFDDNTAACYFTSATQPTVTINLGSEQNIRGIEYTPDQSRYPKGIAFQYRIEVSADGNLWQIAAEGELSNIENSPVRREIIFSHPCTAVYLRFTATKRVNDAAQLGISELNILLNKPWETVFQDDFNTDGAPDPTRWKFAGRKKVAWAKYNTDSPEVAYQKGGNLVLAARKTPANFLPKDTARYQTGALTTKDLFSFTYGKVSFRARFEGAKGSWPALWMMPQTNKYGAWPNGGEMDIMEHLNHDAYVYQTIHTPYTQKGNNKSEGIAAHGKGEIDPTGFNIYTVEWYPNTIVLSVNGKYIYTYAQKNELGVMQYPFDQPFYLIVNEALGGNWVGEVDPKELPVQMEIDWVRVSQQ